MDELPEVLTKINSAHVVRAATQGDLYQRMDDHWTAWTAYTGIGGMFMSLGLYFMYTNSMFAALLLCPLGGYFLGKYSVTKEWYMKKYKKKVVIPG